MIKTKLTRLMGLGIGCLLAAVFVGCIGAGTSTSSNDGSQLSAKTKGGVADTSNLSVGCRHENERVGVKNEKDDEKDSSGVKPLAKVGGSHHGCDDTDQVESNDHEGKGSDSTEVKGVNEKDGDNNEVKDVGDKESKGSDEKDALEVAGKDSVTATK